MDFNEFCAFESQFAKLLQIFRTNPQDFWRKILSFHFFLLSLTQNLRLCMRDGENSMKNKLTTALVVTMEIKYMQVVCINFLKVL